MFVLFPDFSRRAGRTTYVAAPAGAGFVSVPQSQTYPSAGPAPYNPANAGMYPSNQPLSQGGFVAQQPQPQYGAQPAFNPSPNAPPSYQEKK